MGVGRAQIDEIESIKTTERPMKQNKSPVANPLYIEGHLICDIDCNVVLLGK